MPVKEADWKWDKICGHWWRDVERLILENCSPDIQLPITM